MRWDERIPPFLREEWEERAAIMEHDARMNRATAERRAAALVLGKHGLGADLFGAVVANPKGRTSRPAQVS